MTLNELIYVGMGLAIALCSIISFSMIFYLSRSKIKEVDQLVYGYEISSDSIFFQGFRVMNYGGAFAWRWSAKRAQLLHIRDQFDEKFQRPFIITYHLTMMGGAFMVLLYVLDKFFLHVGDY